MLPSDINVAYQLRDVTEADGGYMCVVGSHKAAYELPGVNVDFSGQGFGVSADPTALAQSGHLQHVAMKAGDCVLFVSAAAPSASSLEASKKRLLRWAQRRHTGRSRGRAASSAARC